ncbi:acyl-CoA carboxylase subunit epsilon [Amycolatopsis mongoliensis]|uniref:Acyl-CoA carboxylase subunit epsilon n=1 Tax=Amycolatopsis mongoliensis TaxID=715475 RepID=A0A9Y2JQD7_9PSEU|nr:acyl-CoA carboxylase subunit epsilon [Amycolatopsis sp. 4-36]WIY02258.1 acyl-CoA carboxylase subunit epsilon [Amycolatopsis sp. 4-36]
MSAIRVLHGAPDDCELAALTAVLHAVSAVRSPEIPGPSVWGDPAWRAREPRPGAGAWRMSGLPH